MLIKFAAVGQMLFRNDAEDAPAADRDCAVIQSSADFKREPDDERGMRRHGEQAFKRLQTA